MVKVTVVMPNQIYQMVSRTAAKKNFIYDLTVRARVKSLVVVFVYDLGKEKQGCTW